MGFAEAPPRSASRPSTAAIHNTIAQPNSGQLLYVTEGNRVRRIDVDTIGDDVLLQDVFIKSRSDDAVNGRDINGQMCERPNGVGGFIAGEDTGQPNPPAGWGVFDGNGAQVGKLTASYFTAGAEPHGCAIASDGTLFTAEVGFQGFGTNNGQLLQWFAPYDQFPGVPGEYPNTNARSNNFCKLATDLGTAGAVAIDPQGRVYVAETSGFKITRFSPPFPTGPTAGDGCGNVDSTGAPVATSVQRETFTIATETLFTLAGLAFAPNGNLYVSSVLTGAIAEYDLNGNLIRPIHTPSILLPPVPTGNPQDITVGNDGTIYYADLDLVGTLPNVRPGRNGKVWRIRFDSSGIPLPPEMIRSGLAFPDGVAMFQGDFQGSAALPLEWPTLAGGTSRTFFNASETELTSANASSLVERWRFNTGAVVTASPTVATIKIPGAVTQQRAVFISSWDGNLYALDWATGTELWRFHWEDQPGASFPAAGSATVADVNGERLVFFGAGEHMYALDTATGDERWRFAAGTGCRDANGTFPGLCSFAGERNQIESTPLVDDGVVYFGMDINDVARGKGGFYALDAAEGTMRWFFDPESSAVCRPNPADESGPGDQVRRYDGYHSETELGLPVGFLSSRAGCDHPRTRNGCGNIWSSAALDRGGSMLYFASSNCDTDSDPNTGEPFPPMPPNDEAIVALHLDGTKAWSWRPREVDNDDLAFGAAPNLFTIDVDGNATDVLGIGNKDGTYYVIDRDGSNARNGVKWNDTDATGLPYWTRNVVPGGAIGGIIQTAAVDEAARLVLFSTAPGDDVLNPQQPTVHALDMDTGSIVWQNVGASGLEGDASYGPTSAVPGVMIVGSVITPHLRFYDTATGALVADHGVGAPGTVSGVASGATVIDGTVIVGAGIGARSSGGSSPGDFAAYTPSAIVALCVPGTAGCTQPTLTPGVGEIVEGDDGQTVLRVPVTLDQPTGNTITVDYTTVDADAAAPADYDQTSGTVSIPAGSTTGYADVAVNGDIVDENKFEYFLVSFRNAHRATLGGFYGLGLAVIADDDPLPRISVEYGIEDEGTADPGVMAIRLTLDAASGRRVVLPYSTFDGSATSASDYDARAGNVVFQPGVTQRTLRITLQNDAIAEDFEWFGISFGVPKRGVFDIGCHCAIAIIVDDD